MRTAITRLAVTTERPGGTTSPGPITTAPDTTTRTVAAAAMIIAVAAETMIIAVGRCRTVTTTETATPPEMVGLSATIDGYPAGCLPLRRRPLGHAGCPPRRPLCLGRRSVKPTERE